jgi:hypothetical protein
MKRIITIVAAMVIVLTVVTAFADQMPILTTESKDAGTMLYLEEAPGHAHPKRFQGDLLYEPKDVISPTAKQDFSGPNVAANIGNDELPVFGSNVDSGAALYESAFATKPVGITGMAAGGVAREDKNTRIWDNLMGPLGGSDLP